MKMLGFRMDSEFECSEFEPLLYKEKGHLPLDKMGFFFLEHTSSSIIVSVKQECNLADTSKLEYQKNGYLNNICITD